VLYSDGTEYESLPCPPTRRSVYVNSSVLTSWFTQPSLLGVPRSFPSLFCGCTVIKEAATISFGVSFTQLHLLDYILRHPTRNSSQGLRNGPRTRSILRGEVPGRQEDPVRVTTRQMRCRVSYGFRANTACICGFVRKPHCSLIPVGPLSKSGGYIVEYIVRLQSYIIGRPGALEAVIF
jgi:hypothetical protein